MIIYEGTNNLVSGAFLKCFSIVQAYLHSIHNIAVTFNLTPVLHKVEK